MYLSELFCTTIFNAANKLVTRCRSNKERLALTRAFDAHFHMVHSNEAKAAEYANIISQKERLFEAVSIVKNDAAQIKSENDSLEEDIEFLRQDNDQMRSTLALICKLYDDEKWNELEVEIHRISKRYL